MIFFAAGSEGESLVAAAAVAPLDPAPHKDETYSKSKQHSGACSHHGGVAERHKWAANAVTLQVVV